MEKAAFSGTVGAIYNRELDGGIVFACEIYGKISETAVVFESDVTDHKWPRLGCYWSSMFCGTFP